MAQQGTHIQSPFPYQDPNNHYQYPNQQFHHPQNYPNSHPAFIQPREPHPSPAPEAHTQPRQGQHVPNPYPIARAPALMPPPSSLPEDINKRRNLQPQRPNNLWPRELSEEQRQIQDQYVQNASPINPYYAQRTPSTTTAPVAPITSFSPPPGLQVGHHVQQQMQIPASTVHPTPSMTATSLPPAAPAPAAQTPSGPPASTSENAASQASKAAPTQNVPSQTSQGNSAQAPQSTAPNTALSVPQPPSPFEAQRVTALLEINRFLLLELSSLQTKAISPSDTSPTDPTKTAQPRPNPQTSPHYVDYMRRLQSNLAYLASVADRPHKPMNSIPSWPAIMEPPIRKTPEGQGGVEESEAEKGVRERYEGLKELWPEWKGKDASLAKSGSQ